MNWNKAPRYGLACLGLAASVVAIFADWLTEACTEDEPVSLVSEGRGVFVPDTNKDSYRRAVPTTLMVLAIPAWNVDKPAMAAVLLILAWSVLHAAVNVLMGETCPGLRDAKLGMGAFAAYGAAVASAWALAAGQKSHQE